MAESKALSPEVQGLFEKVRLQAEEFSNAFKMIEKSTTDIKSLNLKSEAILQQVRSDSTTLIGQLQNEATEAIELLNARFLKLEDKYSELKSLADIKAEHEGLISDFLDLRGPSPDIIGRIENEIDKCELTIREFKEKAYDELSRTLVHLGNKIDSAMTGKIESESKKLEVRIALRQKLIEGKMQTIEQTLWAIRDEYSSDIRQLTAKFIEIKTIAASGFSISDLDQVSSPIPAGQVPTGLTVELSDRISKLEASFLELESKLQPNLQINTGDGKKDSDSLPDKVQRIEKRIGELYALLSKHGAEFEQYKKKTSTATALAGGAIFLAIIAIILALV